MIRIQTSSPHVISIALNRPEKRNAFNEDVIQRLTEAFEQVGQDESCRAVILCGSGRHFSAGADLDWMRRLGQSGHEENLADAQKLSRLMEAVDRCPVPVICQLQGAAYGGAVGLVACADIVLAADNARLCLSEVRIGLIPAVISPYVIRTIGLRQARRYMLSAEEIPAKLAQQIGLVHEVVPESELEAETLRMAQDITRLAPGALRACKQLALNVGHGAIDTNVRELTARAIAERRATPEAQEGLAAFLEKREPAWRSS